MSDRELLELAAKAAGMPAPYDAHGVFTAWVGEAECGHWWNPLTDDGDALRLAVQLKIHVSLYGQGIGITAYVIPQSEEVETFHEDDIYDCASVRRAIVRAAAFIGSIMQ